MIKPAMVAFADGSWLMKRTGARLGRQGLQSDYFSQISVLSSRDLGFSAPLSVSQTWDRHTRGFGYWTWKPWAILEALKRLPSGVPGVWYVDAGCTISASPEASARMREYLDHGSAQDWGFGFQLDDEFNEVKYTKPEVIEHFRLPVPAVNSGQIQATCIFIRNNSDGLEIIRAWADSTRYEWLFDDSHDPNQRLNNVAFEEHRHDQSVFSALAKLRSGVHLRDELHDFLYENDRHKLHETFRRPLNATRIRTGFSSASMNPTIRGLRLLERGIERVLI